VVVSAPAEAAPAPQPPAKPAGEVPSAAAANAAPHALPKSEIEKPSEAAKPAEASVAPVKDAAKVKEEERAKEEEKPAAAPSGQSQEKFESGRGENNVDSAEGVAPEGKSKDEAKPERPPPVEARQEHAPAPPLKPGEKQEYAISFLLKFQERCKEAPPCVQDAENFLPGLNNTLGTEPEKQGETGAGSTANHQVGLALVSFGSHSAAGDAIYAASRACCTHKGAGEGLTCVLMQTG